MKIIDLMKSDIALFNKQYKTKKEALQSFTKLLKEKKYVSSSTKALELALKREDEFSTGIGNAIAIPHIRDDVVLKSCVLFAKIKPSLDWQSVDNQKVEFVFFIAMDTQSGANSHMDVIASLSKLFMNEQFISEIKLVKNYKNLIEVIEKFSHEQDEEKQHKQENTNLANDSSSYDVVAITACPTGIAHTFMAAKKLEDTAKEMNIKIKVETQGTEGSRNTLTQEDINNAKGVILACDKVIDLTRFAGKENVLEISTSAVIKDAKKQINNILENKGHQMAGSKKDTKASGSFDGGEDLISFQKFGKRLYKSLMTGVSYMLPFVVFGGILIALAFLIDIGHAGDPNSVSNLGSIEPAAKWFKSLGDVAFGMIVPILSAYIAFALVGKFGLLPGFVTGLISSGKFLFALNPSTGQIDWLGAVGSDNATSGFFGAIIGGFLSAALIIVFVKYIFGKLPQSLNGIKNILFIPLFGTLAISALFWIVNIPLIYLNYGFTQLLTIINDAGLTILLGLILGLMMASDLGGPINKAAYVFGITSLENISLNDGTGTAIMAAVMAAGMVPPLGIALSASINRKLWSKEERTAAYSNYIMGLSFISEGAIPFTAEKPKILVPANLVGGALTGLLSAAFGITLNAPHGGVFVFALVRSNLDKTWDAGTSIGAGVGLYIVAILAGSIASMLMIWLLSSIYARKKDGNSTNKEQNEFVKKITHIKEKWFTKKQTSNLIINRALYKKNNITVLNHSRWYTL